MKVYRYHNFIVRSIIAFIASTFIVLLGQWHKFVQAVTSLSFYVALFVSFCVALIIVELIHRLSLYLIEKFGNRSDVAFRILLQFLFGILIPVVIDLCIMFVYCKAVGKPANWNEFLSYDFPLVVGFLITLNYYFFGLLIIEQRFKDMRSNSFPDDESGDQTLLTIDSNKIHVQLSSNDILYFYCTNRKMAVITVRGEQYLTNHSLKTMGKLFIPVGFIQINRSVIINPIIVKGYEKKDRRTVKVIINPQYENSIQHRQNDIFIVTNDHVRGFKDRFTLLVEK